MKVLLNQDVPHLGKAGETKEVADGYARNYLIPRGMVTIASAGALKQAAAKKQVIQNKQAKAKAESGALAERVRQTELVFKVKVGEQQRLYGSITSADIADELGQRVGQEIDKRHVELEEPIRHLGSYKVPVRLGPGVEPSVSVVVEAESA